MDPKRHTRLQTVIRELGKFYGIQSKSQFINTLIELNDSPIEPSQPGLSRSELIKEINNRPAPHKLGEFFLSATEGALTTADLVEELGNAFAEAPGSDLIDLYTHLFQVIWDPDRITNTTAKQFMRPIYVGYSGDADGWSGAYDFEDYARSANEPPPDR